MASNRRSGVFTLLRPNRVGALHGALLLLVLSLVPISLHAQVAEEGLVVRGLYFRGNHSFEADVLEAAIATTKSGWFARERAVSWLGLGEKRRLNEREFRRDVARLRLFYQIHGFLDAQVDTTVLRIERDVYLTFRVTEGPPTRVSVFEIKGIDTLPRRGELVEDLPLRVDRPFDRTLLVATADTIVARLQERGYPEARVLLERREVDREARTASVSLVVEPGGKAVIGEIHVEGTHAVDSVFARKLLATAPGKPFRGSDLSESQRNLYRSELFRYAAVTLDTAHYVAGSGIVPLTVVLNEGSLYRARASVGYGTYDCFRTGIGWTARNALGEGQIFDVSGQVSKIGVGRPLDGGLDRSLCGALKKDTVASSRANFNLSASFRRPVFLSPYNSLALSVFGERRGEYKVYSREDVGAGLTFTRETRARVPVTLAYRISYGATQANAVSFCAYFNACTEADVDELRKHRVLATVTLGAQRTRVNNLLDPARGSAYSFEATTSARVFGSSKFTQFTRLVGDGAWYRPLGNVVVAGHVRAGLVFSPRVAVKSQAGNFIPPEQRFYAGGPNDVRGYHRNELGPIVYVLPDGAILPTDSTFKEEDVSIAATGGNSLLVANLEIRAPAPIFADRLRLAAFVDGGTVWERNGGVGAGPEFRLTPGAGLRFVTPLGPARMDVAWNGYALPPGRLYATREDGDLVLLRDDYQRTKRTGRGFVFQFSVGQAF